MGRIRPLVPMRVSTFVSTTSAGEVRVLAQRHEVDAERATNADEASLGGSRS